MTGAARGIGEAVAHTLAEDGYTVAAVDVRDCTPVTQEIRARGFRAEPFLCDVTDWTALRATIERIETEVGPIVGLACVAGVYESKAFLELDPADWSRIMDVNLDGAFYVCRLAAERMVAHGGGAIACVSSNAAYLAWHGAAHYSASKAGLLGLVKGMALELGPHGIRVNAVCPGTIRTPLNERELSDPATAMIQAQTSPLRRIGAPNDVALAISFLLDPDRAPWITGEALLVDGGFGTHGEAADFGQATNSFPA